MNTQKLNQYIMSWMPELTDPRLWVAQCFDIFKFVIQALMTFSYAAPIACFWFFAILILENPNPLNEQTIVMLHEVATTQVFWSVGFTFAGIYSFLTTVFKFPYSTSFEQARYARLEQGRCAAKSK